MRKLGVDLWCFHDRDIAPVGATLQETNANLDEIADYALSLQRGTSIRPLWGTAQLFSEPHYMLGASTSPRVDVFVRAGAQVKKAMDVTHKLGGDAFNFWGGREGYAHLATTDLAAERARHAAFLARGTRILGLHRWHRSPSHRAQTPGAEQTPVRLGRRDHRWFPSRVQPRGFLPSQRGV